MAVHQPADVSSEPMMPRLAELVGNHPTLAETVVLAVGFVLGLGAVIARGIVRGRLRSRKRGYQVRRLGRGQYAYEEQGEEGPLQQQPFWREVLESVGLSRPLPKEAIRHLPFRTEPMGTTSTIQLPDQARWDEEVPPWAQGRRAEIVERIGQCLGTD